MRFYRLGIPVGENYPQKQGLLGPLFLLFLCLFLLNRLAFGHDASAQPSRIQEAVLAAQESPDSEDARMAGSFDELPEHDPRTFVGPLLQLASAGPGPLTEALAALPSAENLRSIPETPPETIIEASRAILNDEIDTAFEVREEFRQWIIQDRAEFLRTESKFLGKSIEDPEAIARRAEFAYQKRLDQNLVEKDYGEQGKARLTLIDGQPCVRVLNGKERKILLFIEEGKVASDSKHLKRFIAKQQVYKGRAVMIITFKPSTENDVRDEVIAQKSFSAIERHSKNRFLGLQMFSKEWLKRVPRAVYAPVKDRVSGLAFAALILGVQQLLNYGTNQLNVLVGSHANPGLYLATGILAPTVAYFNSTYRNILDLGNVRWQVGVSFALGLVGNYTAASINPNTHGWHDYFNVYDAAGAFSKAALANAVMLNAFSIWNLFIDSYARTYWRQINKIFEDMRDQPLCNILPCNERGNIEFPIFGPLGGRTIEFNGNSTLYEALKFPSFLTKTLDYTGVWAKIPDTDIKIPLGKIIIVASIFPAIRYAANLAIRKKYDKAAPLVKRWESAKDLLKLGPVRRALVKASVATRTGIVAAAKGSVAFASESAEMVKTMFGCETQALDPTKPSLGYDPNSTDPLKIQD